MTKYFKNISIELKIPPELQPFYREVWLRDYTTRLPIRWFYGSLVLNSHRCTSAVCRIQCCLIGACSTFSSCSKLRISRQSRGETYCVSSAGALWRKYIAGATFASRERILCRVPNNFKNVPSSALNLNVPTVLSSTDSVLVHLVLTRGGKVYPGGK